jgi:hypothetical protein
MPDQIAERVLNRFLQAAISEEKLNEILLRIRKGATSSLNWTQLAAVFAVLDPGWKLEKIVGLCKLYGYQGNEDSPERFWDGNLSTVEARHKAAEQFAVTSLPTNPKHGQLYMMDLTPIEPYRGGGSGGKEAWEFALKPWMGHEGWRTTSPDGKTFDELPGRYELGNFYHGYKSRSRGKLSLSDTLRWLGKETNWLDQINKKLGMDAHEPAAPRTRDGTGTCPVCFQNIKAKPEMVLHGYRRPGTGQVHGNCFGMGFLPFEVSVKGTKAYLDEKLEPQLKSLQTYLDQLKSGKVTQIPSRYGRQPITPEDPIWPRILRETTEATEHKIKGLEAFIDAHKRLIQHWKERPLPKEGEHAIDWFTKGQRP